MKYSRSKTLLAMLASGSLALLHAAPPVDGAIITWTGGGADDLFSNNDNWDDDSPVAGDDAVFDINADVLFDDNEASDNLIITSDASVEFDLATFTYAISESIVVGQGMGDDASLLLLDGTVTAPEVIIGAAAGAAGALTIGADATLDATDGGDGLLVVGDAGTGVLTILADGQVDADELVIGNSGEGTLVLEGDGVLNSEEAVLGVEAGSTGTATIEGAWTNTDDLTVGEAGTGTLNIIPGGEVTVTAGDVTIGGAETGVGTVNVDGMGTLTLTAGSMTVGDAGTGTLNVEEDGVVDIAAGGLTVGAAATGTGSVNVSGGTLDVNDVLTVGAAGAGTLTIEEGGTVDSNGNDAVIGDEEGSEGAVVVTGEDSLWTAVAELTVGNEGSGSLTIEDGGAVASGDATIGAAEGGSGTVTVSGEDENEVASSWAITGTLTVGDEGDGELNVADGGMVSTTGDGSIGATEDGGTGSVTVDGDGSLLDIGGDLFVGFDAGEEGAADITGTLMVTDDGAVAVGGAGGLTVNETGLLGGDGMITGDVNVFGWLSPGASIGTLNIDGNLELQDGSILQIEYNDEPIDVMDVLGLDPDNLPEGVDEVLLSDLVAVTGTITLNDGTVIEIVKITGGPVPGDAIIILQADGGGIVEADLDGLVIPATFIVGWIPHLVEEGAMQFILLLAEFDPEAAEEFLEDLAALGPNFESLGAALVAAWQVGELTEILDVVDELIDDEAAMAAALQSLMPLQHGAATFQSIRTAQLFNNAFWQEMSAHRRSGLALGGSSGMMFATANPTALRAAIESLDRSDGADVMAMTTLQDPGTLGGFIRGLGIWDSVDSKFGERTGHRARTAGVHGGVHMNFTPEFLVGLHLGYLNTDLDFRDDFGDGEIHTFRVGPHASLSIGDFFIDGSVTYGYHRNEIDRETILGTARGKYDAHDVSVFGQAGYDFTVLDRTTLTPMAGLEFTHLRTDSFTESGAPGANLAVDRQRTDSLRLRLGAKIAHAMDLGGMTIVPEVYGGWAHEFLDRNVDITSRFLAGGPSFTTRTAGVGRDSAQVAAGVSALFDPNMAVFIRYEGEFASARTSHGVVGGLNVNF